MAKGKPPAFQLYAKDVYTGTSDLSSEEFGAYMRGMIWSWDNGPLPLDRARLARVLLLDRADLERVWSVIGINWVETPEGFLNDRLETQRAELAAYHQSCVDGGKKSAEKRKESKVAASPLVSTLPTTLPSTLLSEGPRLGQVEGQGKGNTASSSASASTDFDLQTPIEPAKAKSVSPEPAQTADSEPPLLTFPTVGTGPKSWALTASRLEQWRDAYPGLDVMAECRKALVWCDANSTKRKTASGMPSFLVKWLNQATNSGGPKLVAPANDARERNRLAFANVAARVVNQ